MAHVRIDGHATWVNSAALRAAGIERATRDPDGGLIARDAGGEPTGLLPALGLFVGEPESLPRHHAAVTRRPRTNVDHGWQPEQRMTREEPVCSFTTWNAFASRQEREIGSLEVGKQADVVVLSGPQLR